MLAAAKRLSGLGSSLNMGGPVLANLRQGETDPKPAWLLGAID